MVDQLTAWKRDVDKTAWAVEFCDVLMKSQIFVYGLYGMIFLLNELPVRILLQKIHPRFDPLDAISEQTAYTYADATIKILCSACLAATRHASALVSARREKAKADGIASDLNNMIHDANAPIFALDAKGNISLWNGKLTSLTGAKLADVMGKPIESHISEECRPEFLEVFEARKRGEIGSEQYHCDMIVQNEMDGKSKGSLVSIIMTATARHDSEGNFIGIVCIGSDISEVAYYKAVEETKNQFMAVVSHELKSPLHGIIGLVECLLQKELISEKINQLKMVKSCAVRLLDMVINIMQICILSGENANLEEVDIYGYSRDTSFAQDNIDISLIIEEVCMLVTNATDKANRPLLNPLVTFRNNISTMGSRLPTVQGQ